MFCLTLFSTSFSYLRLVYLLSSLNKGIVFYFESVFRSTWHRARWGTVIHQNRIIKEQGSYLVKMGVYHLLFGAGKKPTAEMIAFCQDLDTVLAREAPRCFW